MHYYMRNIGDYAKATQHLNNIEDLAYRRMIDMYYDQEKPLMLDIKALARLLNLRENTEEISNVLADFFVKTTEGYFHTEISKSIEEYKGKADRARSNGKMGGRPRKKEEKNPEKTTLVSKKTQKKPDCNPEETGLKANHKPVTSNHKPVTSNQEPPKSEDQDLFAQNIVGEVLDYLNSRTGSKFTKLDRQSTSGMSEILQHGYTKQDMIDVINIKCDEWLTKKDFRNNLTPKILFSTRNFEGYLSQARMSAAMAESMNDVEIVGAWNSLGLVQHHGITTKAKQEMQNTYTVYKDRMIKKKKEVKSIGEWAISYISGGFSNYIKRNHRENSSGWIADLEYAVRLSTYEKIINIKE